MLPTLITRDMTYWRIAPDPRLRSHVACYWVMNGSGSPSPADELLFPDGLSEIVFSRARGAFERWKLGERELSQSMSGSYLIGGRPHTVGTYSAGSLALAGVKLDPVLLRALIRTPLDSFRDATLRFDELGDPALLALEDSIADARSPAAIAALLDRHFLALLPVRETVSVTTRALRRQILADRGSTAILRWAHRHRVDVRAVERGFRATMGMTPKQYARVIRFNHAYRSLGAPIPSLDGYYDQSHFHREFRHFTGVAPGVKLAGHMRQGTLVTDHLLEAG